MFLFLSDDMNRDVVHDVRGFIVPVTTVGDLESRSTASFSLKRKVEGATDPKKFLGVRVHLIVTAHLEKPV